MDGRRGSEGGSQEQRCRSRYEATRVGKWRGEEERPGAVVVVVVVCELGKRRVGVDGGERAERYGITAAAL